jgi:hypothetical protein
VPDDIFIGGKQLKNPKNIHPQLDTDSPKPPVQAHGWHGDVSNAPLSAPKMDTHSPLHGLFDKPEFRHPLGSSIPKDSILRHPPVIESEN